MLRPSMMEMGWQKLWAAGNHDLNEGSRTYVLPEEEMNGKKNSAVQSHQGTKS